MWNVKYFNSLDIVKKEKLIQDYNGVESKKSSQISSFPPQLTSARPKHEKNYKHIPHFFLLQFLSPGAKITGSSGRGSCAAAQ